MPACSSCTGGLGTFRLEYAANYLATFDPVTGAETSGLGFHAREYNVWRMHVDADDLGRATEVTDPDGNVTRTVYRDAQHEVRTYRGWDAATKTAVGPTEVMREDRARRYTETLTMSAPPGSGLTPLGTEAVSSVQSRLR